MRKIWLVALTLLSVVGCREEDGPLDGSGAGRLVVRSDPSGADIIINDRNTGRITPDTIRNVAGLRTVRVELDTAGLTYRYAAQVVVTGTDPVVLNGPLMARCQQDVSTCARNYHDEHVVGTTRFGSNALGPMFLQNGQGGGLYWPAQSNNAYLSTATPVFAGMWGTNPVSLGVYDTEFFAGRPAPRTQLLGNGGFSVTQSTWLLPPLALSPLAVARGIQIDEKLIASSAHDGLFLLQLTFRNITRDPLYHIVDSDAEVVQSGVTYTDAYIGIAMDPDIGEATDDWLSYDATVPAVFAYDAALSEGAFTVQQTSPALVGIRVMRQPAGTSIAFNGWTNQQNGSNGDWRAGDQSQVNGYQMLSGGASYSPDQPGQLMGHLPGNAGDARITATVGPLRLGPGDVATVVFAIALAPPTAGAYTSGQTVSPGNPTDTTRPLHAIAGNLRARLLAADAMMGLLQ